MFAPARLAGGSIVLVNRGFVPIDRKDPATRPEGTPRGSVDIVGVMRWPETRTRSRRLTIPRTMSGTCAIPMRSPHRKKWADCGAVLYRSGSRRCRRADCRSRASSKCICPTIICNMPLPGSASRLCASLGVYVGVALRAGLFGRYLSISCESGCSRVLCSRAAGAACRPPKIKRNQCVMSPPGARPRRSALSR